ncbi:MAG: PKD domain-containing protein [Holophagales bacterium]|nr:PKD domain-containing protein [Holophagales bacterium]
MAPPGASFSASKTTARAGEEISFTDTSSPQATAWAWFFGNAGFSACRIRGSPSQRPGVYLVRLMATNGSGSSLSGLTLVTVAATSTQARSARAPGDESRPGPLRRRCRIRFGSGRNPW